MSSDISIKSKLLLIEDNLDARAALEIIIDMAGFEVVAAGSVEEGLHHARQIRFDVLLSDVALPDGSGHELMKELKAAGDAPYAIAMSGYGAKKDVAESLAAGFSHHLIKPFELAALENLLETARRSLR